MSEDTVVIVRDIVVSFLDNKSLARLGCTCRAMRDACKKQRVKNSRKFARTTKELRYLANLTRQTRDFIMSNQYMLHWWYHCHVEEFMDMFQHYRFMIRFRDIYPVAVQYVLVTRDPMLRMIAQNLDASECSILKCTHCWNEFTALLHDQRDAWLETYTVRLRNLKYPMLMDIESGMSDYVVTVNQARCVCYLLEQKSPVMKSVVELLQGSIFPKLRKFQKAMGKFKAKKEQAKERSLSLLGDSLMCRYMRRVSFRD